MNQPASNEPSMDEILSSIRQIIADDEPQQESAAPAQDQVKQEQAAETGGQLTDMLEDEAPAVQGEATTIEVEDGPHPDLEAAPIERKDVAAEALAEVQQTDIEPAIDSEEPLSLSIDQMLKPAPGGNAGQLSEDDSLVAGLEDMVPDASEEVDMEALLSQESSAQNAITDEDSQSIEDLVPDDVAQVVPDDIAFINDDDTEDLSIEAEADLSMADLSIDGEVADDTSALAAVEPAPAMQMQPEAVAPPEPESPLPDKGLSSNIADSLLEPTAQAATSHAFSQLDNLILSQKQGQTIEDLIREMLRPMLKAWLDENLPGVVEQLVQREIERVSRGKR